jgi:protein-S-isoprenylcysteine O-methyltransferase Ste14
MTDKKTESLHVDETDGLDPSGVKWIVDASLGLLLGYVLLFVAAGRLDWVNAWVYVGLTAAYQVASTAVLVRKNPEVLNERGKLVKRGTKPFDRVYVAVYLPTAYAIVVVSGLDARYAWSGMPSWLSATGVSLVIPAFVIGTWAMAVNPFFECTVRIQDDRGQRVIRAGPYGVVRHPGYLALVISTSAYPLILGSWWAFLPAGLLILVVLARTGLEDRTLMRELPGYEEYAAETRYRLLPPVW